MGKSYTHRAFLFLHLLEASVEGEVVAYRVLPARRRVLEVGEVRHYPVVDVLDGQLPGGRLLNGHEDQAAERVRGFGVDVLVRVVRYVRGMRGADGAVRRCTETVLFVLLLGCRARAHETRFTVHVFQQVGVLQPREARELVVIVTVHVLLLYLVQPDLPETGLREGLGWSVVVELRLHFG